MTRVTHVVIGGGLNGLVAAALLARAGKSVCLLEQSATLGGMAAPGPDGSARMAHLLYNLSPRVARDLGFAGGRWPLSMTELPSVSLSPEGAHVVVRGARATLADGTPHAQAAAFATLHGRLTRWGALLRHLAEAAPPGGLDGGALSMQGLRQMIRLGRVGLGLRGMGKPEMRAFLQALLSNAHDLILDELVDGPLAGLLAADAVRGAAAGPRSPGTVFSLIYRMGHGGAASVPKGGMGALIDAVAGVARAAGARVETGAKVARILVEGDRVTGVETETGETIGAKAVLVSPGAQVACALAGHRHFDIEATNRLRGIRARGTAAKINLTLDGTPEIPGLPADLLGARLVLAPSAEAVELAFNPSKYRRMSDAPVIEAVMPGLTDDSQPKALLSAIVQYAPHDLEGGWSDAARDRLLKITLERLAQVAPGLPARVTAAEVITPDRIAGETGVPGGHWHHAEMALDQLLALRPANGIGRYALGPKGLFLCGASAHPGGDLMGLAGLNAARAALEAAS